MGFRNRRRHRGGGGGGGQHHHHHHGFFGGEPNGLNPGDDVGNRKSFKPVFVPPEDLGNRKDPEEAEWIPEDNIGNRVDQAPTHELSGVLLDLHGKRRRGGRPKGVSAPERIGRFLVGGVNPLIAGGSPQNMQAAHEALSAMSFDDAPQQRPERGERSDRHDRNDRNDRNDRHDRSERHERNERNDRGGRDRDGREGGRREQRRFESVDGHAASQDVSERRAQRFFDFAEDDRFEYTLKTPPEQKRKEAEDIVSAIAKEAGRDATVVAKLLQDGTRPKVLVTIEERGPAADLPAERRAPHANEPLFMMGNAALMSLNYLVNKIVNRYPDDRIRLAVLPASDEKLYMDSLAEHQRTRGTPAGSPAAAPAPALEQRVGEQRPAPAPAPVEEPREEPVVEAAPAASDDEEGEDDAARDADEAEEADGEEGEEDAAPAKRAKKAAAKKAPAKKAAPRKKGVPLDDDKPKRGAKKPARKAPAVESVVLKRS